MKAIVVNPEHFERIEATDNVFLYNIMEAALVEITAIFLPDIVNLQMLGDCLNWLAISERRLKHPSSKAQFTEHSPTFCSHCKYVFWDLSTIKYNQLFGKNTALVVEYVKFNLQYLYLCLLCLVRSGMAGCH